MLVKVLYFFNLSLQEGIVPDSYKDSILKTDDPSQPSNYRPVTLLNSEDIVFERQTCLQILIQLPY